MEIGVAVFFVGSYLLWPSSLDTTVAVFQFILWLISGVLLAILFAYDLKWFLLPDVIVFPLIAVGALVTGTQFISSPDHIGLLLNVAGAVTILSGLYYVLHRVSKGQWIGFGDVKLGLALALLLVDWQLAFIALFAANLIGCLIVIPGMLSGKLTRTTRIPFGPLLIVGMVVAMIWGPLLVRMYFTLSI
jgi:leader peptidase (prepilin peptidase)/N-methyltransferase